MTSPSLLLLMLVTFPMHEIGAFNDKHHPPAKDKGAYQCTQKGKMLFGFGGLVGKGSDHHPAFLPVLLYFLAHDPIE